MKSLYNYVLDLFKSKVVEIYLVEIIYKNGQRVSMWCSGYTVRENTFGELSSISIYSEHSSKYPSVRYGVKLGISDISSFWKVATKKVKVD